MAENGDAGSSDQPQESGYGRRDESDGDCNTSQCSIHLRRGSTEGTNLKVTTSQFANSPHATSHKDDVEEKPHVGEQAVDGEHDKNNGIIAGEIAEVVVDSALNLPKVVWLRQSLEVEELGDRFDVGKSRRKWL